MPVYTTTKEAVQKHPKTSVFVNFASFRSVHETTMEAMNHGNLKTPSREGLAGRQGLGPVEVVVCLPFAEMNMLYFPLVVLRGSITTGNRFLFPGA